MRRVSVFCLASLLTSCGSSPTTAPGPQPTQTANRPPTIGSISVSPLTSSMDTALMGATNLTFSVTNVADPDGDPLGYAWDFGDGVAAQVSSPSHVYSASGAFTVRVTVADGKGASVSTATTVKVASLNGTWKGSFVVPPGSFLRASHFTLVITHTGSALSGIWTDDGGAMNHVAFGFLKHPFGVAFSCESCPSNGTEDLVINGTPGISLDAPAGTAFDVYNSVSGTCSRGACTSFYMSRR